MKDFRSLKVIDLFRGLFERAGVEYPIMRRIVEVKLTMDGRRTPTIFNQQGRKKEKPEENGFMKSLMMYVILSVMLVPIVLFEGNLLFQMSLFFGIVMFIVMTSMISDFSNVLLDVKDKGILLTKPVGKKTISAAKMVHISIYLFFLTAAVALVPIGAGTARHGLLFLLLSLLCLILMDLFIVVLTAMIYYVILRFFDGEKLKDVINYVQIVLSIMIVAGYQVLVRAFSFTAMEISYQAEWWQFLLPPFWFAAPFQLLMGGEKNVYLLAFTALAVIIPLVSIFIYIRVTPAFERNLQKLNSTGGESRRKERIWKQWMAGAICRSKEERFFFRFADQMMRNEREFRLKVYPSLGMAIIFPFVFMLNDIQINSYAHLITTKWYLSIYTAGMMIPNAVAMLRYSGKYKGAWIYQTAPVKSLAPLYSAALKVFIVNLFLPVYLVLSIIFLIMFGIKIFPDLVAAFVASVLFTAICSNFLKGRLPFSESFADANASGGVKMIAAFLLIAVFIGIHYAVTFVPFGVLLYFLVLLGVTAFAWRYAFRTIWDAH